MPSANDGAAKFIIIPGPPGSTAMTANKQTLSTIIYGLKHSAGKLLLFLDLREADRQIAFCSDEMQVYYSSAGNKI